MQNISFFSTPGVPLVADLYLPDVGPPEGGFPFVVACLGWGSVKELMEPWGTALSEAGYGVLVVDYRGFGASGGTRGQCFPSEHIEDIRAAITMAGELDGINGERLALLGVSYGGAIAVATGGVDQRPAAIISIVGYGSGARHLRAIRTSEQWLAFRRRLADDRRQRVMTGRSDDIDPDEILLRDDEARAWRRRVEEQYPHMAFRTTLESAERIIEFRPENYLPYETPTPILFIHAGEDTMVPVEESERMWRRAADPKKLEVIPGAGHHDVHSGDVFRQVIDHADTWLKLHLPGRAISG